MKMIPKIIAVFLLAFSLQSNVCAQVKKKKEVGVNYNPKAKPDSSKKSIKAAAVGKIGKANIIVNYHSPAVRKRIIWGGLVPFDDVWVTGAHNATNIVIDKSFVVGSKKISAGKYALFTIPGEDEWTIIINKNWDQHLAFDYNQADDIVRIKAKPVRKENTLERLQYFIIDNGNNKGTIGIGWEKLFIEFPIQVLK